MPTYHLITFLRIVGRMRSDWYAATGSWTSNAGKYIDAVCDCYGIDRAQAWRYLGTIWKW